MIVSPRVGRALRAMRVLAALWLTPQLAFGDIVMTRMPDGTLHFTNRPGAGGRGATVVVRSQERSAPRGRTQVITATGNAGDTAAPVQDAATRSLYQAAARDPTRYTRYDEYIREAATLYQLPEALVRAVIKQESDFNEYSVSSCGASGLMQLMPDTARSMGVTDVLDPRLNILGGTRFLRLLANMFQGNLMFTLAAYNAGPNAVIRYAGVPPFEETQGYVRHVMYYYYQYRAGVGAGASVVAAQ